MYDMAHEPAWAEIMSYREASERCSILLRPPTEKAHWHEKWRAVDAYLMDIRGILTRVGDETVGEMWSLYDGRNVLNEIDPCFGDNIDRHIRRVLQQDIFHVSANTDPKGDRSQRPQDQDPDMMVQPIAGARLLSSVADETLCRRQPKVRLWPSRGRNPGNVRANE